MITVLRCRNTLKPLQRSAMILGRSVASMLLAALLSPLAQAQEFPTRLVRIVVPYPAGGGRGSRLNNDVDRGTEMISW